jgi:hypothetical protein
MSKAGIPNWDSIEKVGCAEQPESVCCSCTSAKRVCRNLRPICTKFQIHILNFQVSGVWIQPVSKFYVKDGFTLTQPKTEFKDAALYEWNDDWENSSETQFEPDLFTWSSLVSNRKSPQVQTMTVLYCFSCVFLHKGHNTPSCRKYISSCNNNSFESQKTAIRTLLSKTQNKN